MHLTDTQIALFIEKKLTSPESVEVMSHIAHCAMCAEKLAEVYKLAASFENLPLPEINKDIIRKAENIITNNGTANNKGKAIKIKFAFAGIVVLLAASVTFLLLRNEPIQTQYRSDSNVQSGITLTPPDEAVLGRNELNFEWSSVKGSIAYRFLLYEENGSPVSSNLVEDTSFTIPDSIKLMDNTIYLWRIEIIFPDRTKQRSDLNVFTFSK